MIALVLFDLDGVLVKTKEIHWEALNMALAEIDTKYIISFQEHVAMYDGLKTNKKLEMLTDHKGLPPAVYEQVWVRKQEFTKQLCAERLQPNPEQIEVFEMLDNEQYVIGCCSNAIRETTVNVLKQIGLVNYFDVILSNEDVKHAKPHPEMYWKAMSLCGVLPSETIVFEDSPPGLAAAEASGATVIRVESPLDIKMNFIFNSIAKSNKQMKLKWSSDKVNVLIPMAGAGTRFEKAGYTFPKPLIEVHNKPMIQLVVENIGMDANHIFIVQRSHREKYNLDVMMNLIRPRCQIVEVDGLTEGAACTTLLAEEYINNNNPLIIANSDQFVEWNPAEFMYYMQEHDFDGAILTFKSAHPKWSFAKADDAGLVTEVAEKNPISDNATVGIYYWRRGADYVKYAKQMIAKNIRVNNEFYVCPVFNEAIADGKRIKIYPIDRMWGLGTPEDLNTFMMLGPK
jgi:HAD superfamily hydrolase (TIGR01509 family)